MILVFLVAGLILRSRKPKVPVWALMSFAAFMTLAFGLVGIDEIASVVNLDVILFLVGMFSIVALAESSGLLNAIALAIVSRFETRLGIWLASSLLFGLLAAFAVNDTVALIGPPIALMVSRAAGIDPRAMFLLLAFSLTIGSAMTPIGNPQNVLIAVESGLPAPFISFVKALALPTLINLVVTPLLLWRLLGLRDGKVEMLAVPGEAIENKRDAVLSAVGIVAAVSALVANDALAIMGLPHVGNRGFIPFVVAAGMYMVASDPRRVLSGVDWGTVIFFITMFVAMEGVWRSGVLQPLLRLYAPASAEGQILWVVLLSLLLSQLLSNVPFVKLYITFLKSQGVEVPERVWLALASSSTIAGNLTLLGAASNIIILEVLESRYGTTVTFKDFLKVGAVVTAVNTAVYLLFLAI